MAHASYTMHRVTNYPLAWPKGRLRTKGSHRESGRFRVTLSDALQDLDYEIGQMGGAAPVVSTNLEPRLDGRPRSGQRKPDDSGVACYFIRSGVETVIACDRYTSVDANVRAIGKTLEALRSIERWGSSDMFESAFRAYQGLPGPGGDGTLVPEEPVLPWWETLGVLRATPQVVVDAALRALRKDMHPDRGGDNDAFNQVQLAAAGMRRERGLE